MPGLKLKTAISILLAAGVVTGCTSVKKSAVTVGRSLGVIDDPRPKLPEEAPKKFRESIVLLEEMKYEQALAGLETFLRDEPTSPWTQSAAYHHGRALEGLERWAEAADQFRQVIRATEKVAPKLQAMSLYHLSFCHEALADDQQTLANLHDLIKRSSSLPREIRSAELPARLAGAYARVGNFDKAVEYYKQAESGVGRLKTENKAKTIPEWLPRTLFYMGTVSARNVSWADFETALRPLARSQVYLLQAAELGVQPWAERAEKNLVGLYASLWNVIENPPDDPSGEPLLKKRETQHQQWERAELLLETLKELKARSLKTEVAQGSEDSKQILGFSDDLEKKIQQLFAQRLAGEGPTEESLRRKASVRGRVVAPDESLEKKFLKSSRSATTSEDPNL